MEQIEFRPNDIESDVRNLLNEITTLRNNTSQKISHNEKFENWIKQLTTILYKISTLKNEGIIQIEEFSGCAFKNKDLVVMALLQPNLKNTFHEMKEHFGNNSNPRIPVEMLDYLEAGPETAKSLAWLGDAAIHFAISLAIWKPELTTEVLHNNRKDLETNEKLSELCEKWALYKYRVHLDPDDKKEMALNDIRGTLTEAVVGVIFIENGIDGVKRALSLPSKIIEDSTQEK